MIYKNCGAELKEGMFFCGECGTSVSQKKMYINCGAVLPRDCEGL